MGFKPMDWYCQPKANGVWVKAGSAFGSYTPCAIDSMIICVSHLVLCGLSCYRMWMIKKNSKARRFRLRSNYYNYLLCVLAGYSTAEPLLRLVMGSSLFNPSGKTVFAPFEMTTSIIESLAWCSMLTLLGLETKIYIREFRWYVRFGVLYVLVGVSVVLNLILGVTVTDSDSRSALYLYTSTVCCQAFFGILLLFYVPNLDPYPGYISAI